MGQVKSAPGVDVACQSVAFVFLKRTERKAQKRRLPVAEIPGKASWERRPGAGLQGRVGHSWGGSHGRVGGGGVPIQAIRTMGQGHQPAAYSLPIPLKRNPGLHPQSRHRGVSSVCPPVARGGATCPGNLLTKPVGSRIAQVRFHPWSLRNRSANATAPQGEGRGRDNGGQNEVENPVLPGQAPLVT